MAASMMEMENGETGGMISQMEYEKKIECMIEQYNNFTIDVNGTKYNINGNDTIGENIADNGGIKIGYRAFLKANAEVKEVVPLDLNLTAQQLFWVGNAQYYCLWNFEEYRNIYDDYAFA